MGSNVEFWKKKQKKCWILMGMKKVITHPQKEKKRSKLYNNLLQEKNQPQRKRRRQCQLLVIIKKNKGNGIEKHGSWHQYINLQKRNAPTFVGEDFRAN